MEQLHIAPDTPDKPRKPKPPPKQSRDPLTEEQTTEPEEVTIYKVEEEELPLHFFTSLPWEVCIFILVDSLINRDYR